MTAQIIQFPMDRVRPAQPIRPASRISNQGVYQVRTSIRVARALIFWTLVATAIYALVFSSTFNQGSAMATSEKVSTSQSNSFDYVTVGYGDTLWSLAEKYAPNRDPRDFISDLVALNSLNDTVIDAGMRLALPRN